MDYDTPANSMDCRPAISSNLSAGIRRFLAGGPVNGLAVLVIAWCGLYALIFLYHGISLVLYPFDVDNSEAYLVYQGMRLSEGHFLYPPLSEPPYLVDNYPPLYPMMTGLGFLATEPNFHWPRLISLISTLTTAALIGYWVFLRTRNRYAAGLSGLIYLSFYHVNDWGALARVDALGVALALSGLVIFEKQRSWMKALPFIVLALFTRQTLFAAPLAIFATLLSSGDRKSAFRYLGALLGYGAILGMILLVMTSGRAWNHLVLYNANQFRVSDVLNYLNQWMRLYMVWGCVPLVIAIWHYPRMQVEGESPEEKSKFPLLFWFTLFAIGEALLCGKIGSAPNYLLSLVAASCMGIGLIVHTFQKTPLSRNALPLLVFLCACLLQLGGTWHWPHSRMMFSETPARLDGQQAQTIQNLLSRIQGPILSERAGVALLAGHPPIFDPFIMTQLAQEGRWDQTPLLDRIRRKEFPVVLLQFSLDDPKWDRERFTPEMIATLQESYSLERKVVRYGSGILRYYLYRPKS